MGIVVDDFNKIIVCDGCGNKKYGTITDYISYYEKEGWLFQEHNVLCPACAWNPEIIAKIFDGIAVAKEFIISKRSSYNTTEEWKVLSMIDESLRLLSNEMSRRKIPWIYERISGIVDRKIFDESLS